MMYIGFDFIHGLPPKSGFVLFHVVGCLPILKHFDIFFNHISTTILNNHNHHGGDKFLLYLLINTLHSFSLLLDLYINGKIPFSKLICQQQSSNNHNNQSFQNKIKALLGIDLSFP